MIKIQGSTGITGIIGKSLAHSLSPYLHNNVYSELKKPYVYIPLPVENKNRLKYTLKGLQSIGAAGINVTIPYKEDSAKLVDIISKDAEVIGAINVVAFKNGVAEGHNTDGEGYVLSLKKDLGFTIKNKKILILGAGGSSMALAYSIAKEGAADIKISNRTIKKGENICKRFSPLFDTKFSASGLNFESFNIRKYDLVINCTSSSLNNYDLNFPFKLLKKNAVLSDLMYPLTKSSFLIKARKAGYRVFDGSIMLAYQAALSYELWFNEPPPFDLYKKYIFRKHKMHKMVK